MLNAEHRAPNTEHRTPRATNFICRIIMQIMQVDHKRHTQNSPLQASGAREPLKNSVSGMKCKAHRAQRTRSIKLRRESKHRAMQQCARVAYDSEVSWLCQKMLRGFMPLMCCIAQPFHGQTMVVRHAPAFLISTSQLILSLCIPQYRCLA